MKTFYLRLFSCLVGVFMIVGVTVGISNNYTHYSIGDWAVLALMYVALGTLAVYFWKLPNRNERRLQALRKAREEILQRRIAEVAAMTEVPIVANPYLILLKPGEVCCYQCEASCLVIKNQVIGHTSASQGVSVRVAKGLTLHSGDRRGYSIRGDVSYTYPGLFSMTNQRMVMTGEKGFDFPIEKLTSMTPYGNFDGIVLQFGGASYTLLMLDSFIIPKIFDLLKMEKEKAQ